jgi:hypothetical protein
MKNQAQSSRVQADRSRRSRRAVTQLATPFRAKRSRERSGISPPLLEQAAAAGPRAHAAWPRRVRVRAAFPSSRAIRVVRCMCPVAWKAEVPLRSTAPLLGDAKLAPAVVERALSPPVHREPASKSVVLLLPEPRVAQARPSTETGTSSRLRSCGPPTSRVPSRELPIESSCLCARPTSSRKPAAHRGTRQTVRKRSDIAG